MLRTAPLISLAAVSGAAFAQPAITIQIDDPVLLPGESTTVTMFAGYGRGDYAVAGIETDFVTSVGSDGWSDVRLLAPMGGPGTAPGGASPSGFDGILAGQVNFPDPDLYADPTNPIAFWQATYTAPIDAGAAFDIDLSTVTRRYDVYFTSSSSRSESRLDELVEGSGTITVVPAPASAVVLAFGALCFRRRRRPNSTGGV
ncbi:MAG: hypothetical protein ACFCBV_03595 [Phycisphaerales bacterium]